MSISSPLAASRIWSAVPTTGVFDKCANNCVLYREHVVIPLPKSSRRRNSEPTKLHKLADKKWQMIFARYEPCINEPAKAKSLEFKSKLNIGDPFDLNLPKRTSVWRSYQPTVSMTWQYSQATNVFQIYHSGDTGLRQQSVTRCSCSRYELLHEHISPYTTMKPDRKGVIQFSLPIINEQYVSLATIYHLCMKQFLNLYLTNITRLWILCR
jgi:hypothetical protein